MQAKIINDKKQEKQQLIRYIIKHRYINIFVFVLAQYFTDITHCIYIQSKSPFFLKVIFLNCKRKLFMLVWFTSFPFTKLALYQERTENN